MNRRELLTLGGAALSAWLAGCSGDTDPPDRGETSEEETDTRKRETGSAGETSRTESTSETPETGSTSETSESRSSDETAEFAIVAGYPTEATDDADYRRETVFTPDDFTEVGPVEGGDGTLSPSVRVEPTDEAARRLVDVLTETGFTDEGVASCRWREDPDDPGWCLFTVLDGEITYAASLAPGLASSIESEAYLDDPSFLLSASDTSEAEKLRAAIRNETGR